MEPKTSKSAMQAVMESMGRAAREARARRFMGHGKPKVTGVEVTAENAPDGAPVLSDAMPPEMGDKGNPPTPGHDMATAPAMSPEEMDELLSGLQR